MALDSANKRGSLIYNILPFASGAVDQESRQVFIPFMFASPLAGVEVEVEDITGLITMISNTAIITMSSS